MFLLFSEVDKDEQECDEHPTGKKRGEKCAIVEDDDINGKERGHDREGFFPVIARQGTQNKGEKSGHEQDAQKTKLGVSLAEVAGVHICIEKASTAGGIDHLPGGAGIGASQGKYFPNDAVAEADLRVLRKVFVEVEFAVRRNEDSADADDRIEQDAGVKSAVCRRVI